MGWGSFFGGIGKLLEKGATYLPGRVERLKNEREQLLMERQQLIKGAWYVKTSRRVEWIDARIAHLERMLVNKAQD